MNQQKIGLFIQEKRKEKKLTQQELAKTLGVTNRAISNWEKGKYMPDYNLLIPLTKELGISVSELINGEETTKQESTKNIEKFIEFLKHLEKIKNKKYKTIGLIGLITGLTIILVILLFIPSNKPIGLINNKSYIQLGFIISSLGLLYMTQREKISKVILINISFIIFLSTFILFHDFINVKYFKSPPRFYITEERIIFTGHIYYQTKFYDVYACEQNMYASEIGKDYIIIKKDKQENMYNNLKKYCNSPY